MSEKPEETPKKYEGHVLRYEKVTPKDRKYVIRRNEPVHRARLSEGDYIILRMIQNRQKDKRSLTEILHRMIGVALDCEYNKHHELIERLRERISLQVLVLRRYRKKYGDITRQSTLS